jgi:tetratricopeptide (TPR) repeat protein
MEVGYSAKEISGLLGLSVGQVRGYAQRGVLSPRRERGRLRFSFQDVVLLRAAQGLSGARIPSRRIRRALRRLRAQLPDGRPLTGVAIAAEGDRVIVRDGGFRWNPESGQALFDFSVAELVAGVAPLRTEPVRDARAWFEHACALEAHDPSAAVEAYRRAIELDVERADAHINLGRLLHEAGRLPEALAHYHWALAARPDDVTARFNLGVALDDLHRAGEAIVAYREVLRLDPGHADAHFNLARLYEQSGVHAAAVQHRSQYLQLTRGR